MRAAPTAAKRASRQRAALDARASTRPVYFWVPSIAPSGMAFYTRTCSPKWKGNLFVGALAGQHLVRSLLTAEIASSPEEALLTTSAPDP